MDKVDRLDACEAAGDGPSKTFKAVGQAAAMCTFGEGADVLSAFGAAAAPMSAMEEMVAAMENGHPKRWRRRGRERGRRRSR